MDWPVIVNGSIVAIVAAGIGIAVRLVDRVCKLMENKANKSDVLALGAQIEALGRDVREVRSWLISQKGENHER